MRVPWSDSGTATVPKFHIVWVTVNGVAAPGQADAVINLGSIQAACSKLAGFICVLKVGAKGGTRTPTLLRAPAPQAGASANSATFARVITSFPVPSPACCRPEPVREP